MVIDEYRHLHAILAGHMSTSSDTASAATAGSRNALSMTALILGATAIGFSPIFVRLSEIGPTATAFWRVALAVPALWCWALLSRPAQPDRRNVRRGHTIALLAVGLAFAGDLSFWHWSIKLTSVANATLLANLSVVFVTVAAWLLFRQRVSALFTIGMMLALVGTVTLIGRSFAISAQNLLGDLFGVVTAAFYTVYLLCIKRLRDDGFATATIVSWGTLITALTLLPVVWLSGEALLPQTAYGWLILAALAFISHAGGQTLIAYSLAKLPATFSSVALLLEPVVAAVLAWMLFGEHLGPVEIAGSALVLGGIYVARRGSVLK